MRIVVTPFFSSNSCVSTSEPIVSPVPITIVSV
jgi:hypothetical protein